MAKGYWVAFFRSITNTDALAEYARVAGPAIEAAGGRFLARGNAVRAFEAGLPLRSTLVEFDSVEQAIRGYESAAYQAAVRLLAGAAERDVRILEGL